METIDYAGLAALITAMGSVLLGILNRKRQQSSGGRLLTVEQRLTSALGRIDHLDEKLQECEDERKTLTRDVRELTAENLEALRRIKELESSAK